MYQKFKDTDTVYFDVDDTLVIWSYDSNPAYDDRLVLIDGTSILPHTIHIDLLKDYKNKGNTIVVWSQGGSDWAEKVVKGLSLEEYVDVILTKPTKYYDDLPSDIWLPGRSFEDME